MMPSMNSYDPSFENKEYHVFLSFRGPDVRKGFVDHLYASLTIAGINAFLDTQELEPGENIAPSIQKAIELSGIRIPIFSSNYAESAWCLKEVSHMCKSKGLIIPLFYNVKPTDVRYPDSGPFSEAFRRHKNRYPEDTIADWKSALFDVSSFSGWSLDITEGYEGKLVKRVVQDVLNKLNKLPLEVAEFVVGLEEHKRELNNLLQIGLDKQLRTVGICGMGGVGKTTLAKAIYNDIYRNFEAACFLSDVRLKAQGTNGISELQGQILKDLLKVDYQVNDDARGKGLIKDRLRYIRSLVILDDVDNPRQLDAIRGDWFGPGSRIIVTTRDENVLNNRYGDKIFSMEGIQNDQALELFSWHAFLRLSPDPDFKDLAERIVKSCGGLPLSLEVLGAFLYDKRDRKLWIEALKQLEGAMYDSIHGRLKISYQGLNSQEKEIFLDIACIFVGKETQTAIRFWEASDFAPNITLLNLNLKSLIKISDDGIFIMHDHLRDMGRAIVLEESKLDPGKRSRLWKLQEVQQIIQENRGTENVRCLILEAGELDEEFILQTDRLASMRNLQLLWLGGVTIEGDFENLSPNLRWLKLEHCAGLECLRFDWNMEHLAILDLTGSDIKELWSRESHSKPPKNLKVLNLNSCRHLERLPDLSQHTSLVRLHLNDCRILRRVPNYIGLLQQLEYLDFSMCENLEDLSHSITKLCSLKHLLLSCCYGIAALPNDLRGLGALKVVDLSFTSIDKLPDSFGSLSGLEKLSLESCTELQSLPESIGELKCLTHLAISQCDGLTFLPPSIGELKRLRYLHMKGCRRICYLPEEIGNLVCLQDLLLNKCSSLAELPQIGRLIHLENLLLYRCPNLTSLPMSIGQLKSLCFLDLRNCNGLTTLPASIGELKSLRSLDMGYCRRVRTLPEEFCDLAGLEILNLNTCSELRELPQRFGNLGQLRILNMDNNSYITELPASFCRLKSLVRLEAGKCNIKEDGLPEEIGGLQSLEFLDLESNNLCTLPLSVCLLVRLTKLSLHHCTKLTDLPTLPEGLVELDVGDCPHLKKISDMSNMKKLEVLVICNCGHLAGLPGLRSLQSLKELNMSGCENVKSLAGVEELKCLKRLYLNGCASTVLNLHERWIQDTPCLQELSFCANRIPEWLEHKMQAKIVHQSYGEDILYLDTFVPSANKSRCTGVIFCLLLRFKERNFDFDLDETPLIISIIRGDTEIFYSTSAFSNRQGVLGDQLCVCIYRGNHPLIVNLKSGDMIRARATFSRWVLLKEGRVQLLYESEETGDGNEEMIFKRLGRDLNSIAQNYTEDDCNDDQQIPYIDHTDEVGIAYIPDQIDGKKKEAVKNADSKGPRWRKTLGKLCCHPHR